MALAGVPVACDAGDRAIEPHHDVREADVEEDGIRRAGIGIEMSPQRGNGFVRYAVHDAIMSLPTAASRHGVTAARLAS
jgi:hypothetical protein